MPLGWIDFSKNERNKVLSVLDLLSEAGILDELGIAPVRDGFANLFFPGTSTIQTRAKYFMIVPYALKDLEHSTETNPNTILKALNEIERECGRILVNGDDKEGVIGSRAMAQNRWVKRTPADIYWAGLRNYGIFSGGNYSLSEYVHAMCTLKNQKATLSRLGNRNDNAEEGNVDDKDAGNLLQIQFWKIPTYQKNWIESLSMKLSGEEGYFLKKQIILSFPESMLTHILKNSLVDVFQCKTFQDLASLIHTFPYQIQQDYELASDFSDFLYVLRTVYNIIVSEGNNDAANTIWENLRPDLKKFAAVDLDSIFGRLGILKNVFLCRFLYKSRQLMMDENLEGIKTEIKRRERELKQARAKTIHPGEYDPNSWFGGGQLDYRFGNAKVIIGDIFESEGIYAKS